MATIDSGPGSRAQQLAGSHHFNRGKSGFAPAVPELPEQQNTDFQRGLNTSNCARRRCIAFCSRTGRLAQMPSPRLQPVDLRELLGRGAVLETRLNVEIAPSADRILMIDPDLVEQMLINLVRNAVDAALEQAQSAARGP